MPTRRIGFAAVAALALLGGSQGVSSERFRASEVIVEAVGASGESLEPARLEVIENGVPQAVTAVEAISEPWRIVLYFDQLLLEPPVYRSALLDLAAVADKMTGQGTVEIVLAGEQLTRALPATRDPRALDEALRWLLVRETTEGGQLGVRRDFVEEYLLGPEPEENSVLLEERTTEIGQAIRDAIEEEAELLSQQRNRLLSWLADQESEGPSALLLVTGGSDANPAEYYRNLVGKSPFKSAALGLPEPSISPSIDELGKALSIYSWTTIAYAPPNQGDGLLAEDPKASDPDLENDDEKVQTILQDGRQMDKTTATIDPRKLLDRLRSRRTLEATYSPKLLAPYQSLSTLATATGGNVVVDRLALGDAIGKLGLMRRVVYESDPSLEGARSVTLQWRSGSGGELRTRAWTGRSTPEVVAAQRARFYLSDGVGDGEIFLSAAVRGEDPDSGTPAALVLELDPEGLDTGESQPLRVTYAVATDDRSSAVFHHVVDLRDAMPSENETARFELPVALPGTGEPVLAVFVEDLGSGRWGGTFAAFSVASADLDGALDRGSLILPAPKAVHLMAPQEAMVMGRTTFDTVVSESRVQRVQFLLDGSSVATIEAPPFSLTIDLGKFPETHRLEAIAYGAAGEELGRDQLTVNAGLGSFRVRIVQPKPGAAGQGSKPVLGPVDVEARIETPRGSEVDRVEFYWKDRLVSTRFAPPFVQQLTISESDPSGFVRVVGHLEDGTSSEDVIFVNSPGSAERVEVDLVELYVVVTDREGRPVRGLGKESFQVLEEGVAQDLADFGDAANQPLTVGLAIDSSASMFVKLPDVQDAAATFVRSLRTRRDRAFVVGFGNEPRLARDTTSNMNGVIDGLYRLRPDGQTAIWKAVVYSLVQLQGAGGKKALIVFSDGADEDPDFSYRTAFEFARRVGAPIYFIVSNDEIHRTAGKSLSVRGFLGRLRKLTSEVGGRVFLTKVTDDLAEVYSEIEEELRSQYLVSYYARDLGGNKWRRVTVEVDSPGTKTRTLSGYFR